MTVNLSSIGIEEFEPNVCADTTRNRRILREHELQYAVVTPGFLTIVDSIEAKRTTMYERNKNILQDPSNKWSDYLPMDELPLDFMETAPAWMQRHLNKYNDAIEQNLPESKIPYLPNRCRRRRADGSRCWAWAWSSEKAEGYCRFHCPPGVFNYANEFQKLTDAAKARLVEMQGDALDALEELVSDRSTVPHVRLKAAENILDRTGLAAKQELTISGTVVHEAVDPAATIRERLSQLASHAAPALESPQAQANEHHAIIEAEIVEDDA